MKLGIELYTVKNKFREDPIGTLKALSDMGYHYIELFNHMEDVKHGLQGLTDVPLTNQEFKKAMDDAGIQMVGYQPVATEVEDPTYWESDEVVDRLTDFCCELGSETLAACCEFWPSREYVKKRCDTFNHVGEVCRSKGLVFVYHNHYNDFIQFDGESAFDMLLEGVDPESLKLEVCAYWTMLGLEDPVKIIRKYGNRVQMIHQKDYPLEYIHELNVWQYIDRSKPMNYTTFKSVVKPEHFIEVGEGIMKVQDIIDAGMAAGSKYILVEQDHTTLDEFDSARLSMQNMRKMRGLEWD